MIDLIRKYFEKHIELLKYESIAIFANVGSSLASSLVLLVLGLLILFMFNFALALYLGKVLENNALGFLSVGIFYSLVFIVYLFFSKKKVELKIKDQIVKAALSANKNKNDNNN